MNKIREYKNRFFSLLETQMGDVKPLINEQADPATTTTTTLASNAGKTVVGRKVDCASTKNPAKCKQKVLDVQVKINDTCTKITQKLVEDGNFGPNTKSAFLKCGGVISSENKGSTTTTTTIPITTTTTTTGNQSTTTTTTTPNNDTNLKDFV